MNKILVFSVLLLSFPISIIAQKKPLYFSIGGMKELGVINPNSPWLATGMAKVSALYVQGEYGLSTEKKLLNQKLDFTQNYALRLGAMFGGEPRGEFQSVGFHVGFEDVNKYKYIYFDNSDYPVDRSGNVIEIDKVAIGFAGKQYMIGMQVINVSVNDKKSVLDDYDIENRTAKVKFSTLSMRLEMLYMPSVSIDSTFNYSPYGYFVPRKVTLPDSYNFKKFGVRIRFEFALSAGAGFMMQMGVNPSPKKTSESYNDFRIDLQGGIFYQFAKFRKP